MTRSIPLLQALLLLTVTAASAPAQPADARWEIGLSVGFGPQTTGIYQHRYTPSLSNHPEATGTAGQDVTLRGETGDTLAASVTRMLSRRLGVQLVLAAARSPLGGPSSDYAWTLHYASRQPPDYQPQPLDVTVSAPWPGTQGELRQLAAGANVVFRYPLYDRLSLSFSLGAAVQRLEGEISPLGVTLFSEGGHAVLFPETYRVRVSLQPRYATGLDLGTEFAWRLSDRMSVAFEVRYFAASSIRLDANVDRVLNNDEVVRQTTPAELTELAPLQRVKLDPSFGAALAGVSYRF